MVVNVQRLWAVEWYMDGRRFYMVQGFTSREDAIEHASVIKRHIKGERKLVQRGVE